MKKQIFLICSFVLVSMFSVAEIKLIDANSTVVSISEDRGVSFRRNQRLRSSDGRSIYLYTNRKCELFDGGRLIVTCKYNVQNGEVRLLDEHGRTVYKGIYRMKKDRINLSYIRLNGVDYNSF